MEGLETKGGDHIKMGTGRRGKAVGVESCLLALIGEALGRRMLMEDQGESFLFLL